MLSYDSVETAAIGLRHRDKCVQATSMAKILVTLNIHEFSTRGSDCVSRNERKR